MQSSFQNIAHELQNNSGNALEHSDLLREVIYNNMAAMSVKAGGINHDDTSEVFEIGEILIKHKI